MDVKKQQNTELDTKPNPLILTPLLGKEPHPLEECHEFSISEPNNNVTLAYFERIDPRTEDTEFVLRLIHMDLETRKLKCLDFCMESFVLLAIHAPKIHSLLETQEKALIFQNNLFQVYVSKESESEGFLVHFQDKKKTKVSMGSETLTKITSLYNKIDSGFHKFKARRSAKQKKLKRQIAAAENQVIGSLVVENGTPSRSVRG